MPKRYDLELGVDVQNTWAMSLAPDSPDLYASLDTMTGGDVKYLLVMRGTVFNQFVHFQVLVECWPWLKHGSRRRKYRQAFTAAERNKLAKFYGRFYRWHMVSGVPDRVAVRPQTVHLLQRAIEFCVQVRSRELEYSDGQPT